MATTTNIIFVKSGVQVTIHTTKIEQNITKTVINWTQPTPKGDWSSQGGTGVKTTKVVDLLRNESRFTVDGFIQTDFGVGDTSADVEGKRTDLLGMLNAGGAQVMGWNGATRTVHIDKLSITQEPLDDDTSTTYSVKITAIQGDDYL
jgi:hypothetical protein